MEITTTIKKRFLVSNTKRLHLRPATTLVNTAKRFRSDIVVRCKTCEADAKSLLSIMFLEITHGIEITVIAQGRDAAQAMAAIATYLGEKRLCRPL